MNKICNIIVALSLGWLGCFLLPSSALAGKVGGATEVNEIQFLIDVFQVIMPIYVENSYNQSDANLLDMLKSGYEICNISPQEFKDYIQSLTDENDRKIATTLQQVAPKYLCR